MLSGHQMVCVADNINLQVMHNQHIALYNYVKPLEDFGGWSSTQKTHREAHCEMG